MEKSQDTVKKINSTEHNNGRQEDILGIHHVTAIASDPQKNIDFYTQILGLRLAFTFTYKGEKVTGIKQRTIMISLKGRFGLV